MTKHCYLAYYDHIFLDVNILMILLVHIHFYYTKWWQSFSRLWAMNKNVENAKQNSNQWKLFIKPLLWKLPHWIDQGNICNNGFRNNLHWTICMCFMKEVQRFWINLIFPSSFLLQPVCTQSEMTKQYESTKYS